MVIIPLVMTVFWYSGVEKKAVRNQAKRKPRFPDPLDRTSLDAPLGGHEHAAGDDHGPFDDNRR